MGDQGNRTDRRTSALWPLSRPDGGGRRSCFTQLAQVSGAEGVGFEPTMGCPITVFKTVAIGL